MQPCLSVFAHWDGQKHADNKLICREKSRAAQHRLAVWSARVGPRAGGLEAPQTLYIGSGAAGIFGMMAHVIHFQLLSGERSDPVGRIRLPDWSYRCRINQVRPHDFD